jgi:hypothetical protein
MDAEPKRLTGEVVLRITAHTDGYSVEATPPLSPDSMNVVAPLVQAVIDLSRERIELARAPKACRCGDIGKLGIAHYADRMCVAVGLADNEHFREYLEREIERRVTERLGAEGRTK